jgi:hypothetical protein
MFGGSGVFTGSDEFWLEPSSQRVLYSESDSFVPSRVFTASSSFSPSFAVSIPLETPFPSYSELPPGVSESVTISFLLSYVSSWTEVESYLSLYTSVMTYMSLLDWSQTLTVRPVISYSPIWLPTYRTTFVRIMISLETPPVPDSKMSEAMIIGIVTGAAVVLVLLVGTTIWLVRDPNNIAEGSDSEDMDVGEAVREASKKED